MKKIQLLVGFTSVALSSIALALPTQPFYVAVNAGIFQGSFDAAYRDQTDLIPQNIAQTLQQHGYSEGLAVGYQRPFRNQYLLGAELSANLDSHNASYQSGAANTSFSNSTQIKNHFDLTFVPGVMLGSTVEGYVKLGLSYASLQDNLTSPVGYTPTMTRFNSNKSVVGFAGGIGVKKFVTEQVSVYVEGDYHDYGSVSFANFQNFTASYTHNAHIYSYGMMLGAAYHF
ncbi:MAG: outer membrane beta-barrel protein [Gammaproteobacteria bacterium]|nr:outer membrane beta-barrel protein [Gammaproteobacteria bacterium]